MNGRALVHGISLGELAASDMVDVIHYFFEDDMNFTSGEQAEARSKSREKIYSTMYGRPYKYAIKDTKSQQNQFIDPDTIPFDDGPDLSGIKPFDPVKEPTKSYIPATDFNPESANPFGGTLDAPMK